MKNFKKITAAALAALEFGTVYTAAAAEVTPVADENLKPGDVFVDGDLEYGVLNDGTLAVYNLVNREIENLVIPEEVKGRKVTCIDYFAYGDMGDSNVINGLCGCTSLKSVIIPDSVTVISSYAFYGCTSLESVTIPAGHICDSAFANCTSLKKVIIADNVEEISNLSLSNCTSLEKIEVSSDNANYCSIDGVLYSKDKTKLICYPAAKKETSFTVPETVTEIDNYAFSDCASLKSVTIPDSVTVIGTYVFKKCTSLTDVKLPDNMTAITGAMFYCCTALESLTIPDSVTEIWWKAFFNCTSLKNLTIPKNVELPYSDREGEEFWNCASLEKIDVSSDNAELCSVDGVLFSKDKTHLICYPAAKKETLYTIPNSVTKIESPAFYGSTSLKNIIIPDSVTRIYGYSFQACTSLTDITIPNSVTDIDKYAFDSCTSLKNVNFIGTKEEWNAIGISEYNDCLTNATITFADTTASDPATSEPTTSEPTISEPKEFNPVSIDENLDEETKAVLNGITVTDSNGAFEDGVVMNVSNIEKAGGMFSFDVTFTKDGKEVQPKEKVTVKMPVPEHMKNGEIYVYHYDNNDKATLISSKIENGFVIFETDSFSTYMLTSKKIDMATSGETDSESSTVVDNNTGTDQQPTGIALAIAPVVLAAGAVIVISKKRK